jgi:glycosyltransferase involved in cell wall biosynthesis
MPAMTRLTRLAARATSRIRGGATAPSPVQPIEHQPYAPDGTGSDPRTNVFGHIRGEFGMAEVARSLVTAAQAANVRVAVLDIAPPGTAGGDTRLADAIGSEAPHPINVFCVNANDTPRLMDRLGPGVTSGHYNIGYWFWELSRLPAVWHGAIDRLDEIWVASRFVAEAIEEATTKPVHIVHLAIDASPSRPYRRAEFGLPEDSFVFLFTFSFNSYAARKNPLAVIRAFRAAFDPKRADVALVLKSMNGDRQPDLVREIRDAIGGDERIRLIDGNMSRDEVYGLESVVDSYVSLHRSEGFGLGLAESMFLGKPVIGTAYSGNMEFMNPTVSCLVGYRLTPVGPGEYPFPDGQEWAEPDEDVAIDLMRRLVDDPAFGRALGARAKARMERDFSPAAIGAGIADRLGQILDGRS